nr:hypothetical protein [Candidatus Freyarchaeota archaeon]
MNSYFLEFLFHFGLVFNWYNVSDFFEGDGFFWTVGGADAATYAEVFSRYNQVVGQVF